ncbi:hypothetical protein HK096_008888, partial [Nowakowskiella sp. JEL0078]
ISSFSQVKLTEENTYIFKNKGNQFPVQTIYGNETEKKEILPPRPITKVAIISTTANYTPIKTPWVDLFDSLIPVLKPTNKLSENSRNLNFKHSDLVRPANPFLSLIPILESRSKLEGVINVPEKIENLKEDNDIEMNQTKSKRLTVLSQKGVTKFIFQSGFEVRTKEHEPPGNELSGVLPTKVNLMRKIRTIQKETATPKLPYLDPRPITGWLRKKYKIENFSKALNSQMINRTNFKEHFLSPQAHPLPLTRDTNTPPPVLQNNRHHRMRELRLQQE